MHQDEHELDEHDHEPLTPSGIIDPVIFGRLLRAARIVAGYDRVSDFATVLRSTTGVQVSDRTIYAVERGEQACSLDFFIAAIMVLHPPGASAYFLPSMRSGFGERWLDAHTVEMRRK